MLADFALAARSSAAQKKKCAKERARATLPSVMLDDQPNPKRWINPV